MDPLGDAAGQALAPPSAQVREASGATRPSPTARRSRSQRGQPGEPPGKDLRHRVVIVGGGAGGLELATLLGDTLGKAGRARITLVERERTHFWKPHLHQIAAGTLDPAAHEVDLLAHSHWHCFEYWTGSMTGLDRTRQEIQVASVVDDGDDRVAHARSLSYDTLVMAVGSQTNDFGTPGVQEHAISLETPAQALRFHRRWVNACIRAHAQKGALEDRQLKVVVIGAGATGVELAAELQRSTQALISYGLYRVDYGRDVRLHLLEAGPRILPALSQKTSLAASRLLATLDVNVQVGAKVTRVTKEGVELASGATIPAELIVWAAGVKAPPFLRSLGLETNGLSTLR